MIPKVIHYCWFGRGKKPDSVLKCIESWKKFCPNYEIKEWNEDNFDINLRRWTKEAYYFKKYAFVADVARLYALYEDGGIYMDTDVELIKPLDAFLEHKSFIGFEHPEICLNSGLIGAEAKTEWIKDELEFYASQSYLNHKGAYKVKPNTEIITEHLLKQGLVMDGKLQTLANGLVIYPREWFCPIDWRDNFKSYQTKDTYAIHQFVGSWAKEDKRLIRAKSIFRRRWGKRIYQAENLCLAFLLRFRKLK